VQRQEVTEAIDRLSPGIQKDRRTLGEQARNIGALALYITQTHDTAAMQKVTDLLESDPKHIGANTLLRLTRLNAQGHTGNHGEPFKPADYVPGDEASNLSIQDAELHGRFFSSDYDDLLKGCNVIRDRSSGQDDLLLAAASSVVLRGNGNLHLHDAITREIGAQHYYETATVAAHGRPVRLPEVSPGRLHGSSLIVQKSGINRFLGVDTDISKEFAPRPQWLNQNLEMKGILDAIEGAGVKIHFADDSCVTPHFNQSSENGAATIHMTPPERMAGGKNEYVAILLHEIGHATHELNNRAALHTYGASYSKWHEEAVAQGISVRLLQKVARGDLGNPDAITNQRTIGEALTSFTRIQRNASWAADHGTREVHDAVHGDIIKGIATLSHSENTMGRTEICAIKVLDSARDTLENLKLIQGVTGESADYMNKIMDKQFAKTTNALNAVANNHTMDHKVLAAYTPKIQKAVQSVRDAIPDGAAFERHRTALANASAKIGLLAEEYQHAYSRSAPYDKALLDTALPEAPLLAESSVNPVDRFILRQEQGNDSVTEMDSVVTDIYAASQKLRGASEKTTSPIGRFALQKVSKALSAIGDGMLHAQDTVTNWATKVPDMESSILRFAPKPLQDELQPVLTSIRAHFDMDTTASDLAGHGEVSSHASPPKGHDASGGPHPSPFD
jgi:hypothetical protein